MMGLRSPSVPAFLLAAVLVTACDDEFTPLAPTDLQFSVFGYLDANADTQWVRVAPIRPLILTSPDGFSATVTLEHLGTGQVIVLRDSVFRFTDATDPDGSEGVYAHNFWTTEPIEPGATYRFVAQREGEQRAEAIIEIPGNFAVEVRIARDTSTNDLFVLEGLKHVAFAGATGYFYDGCGQSSYGVPFRRMTAEGDVYTVIADRPGIPARGSCGRPIVERMEVWAAASENKWPAAGLDYVTWGLAVPDGESNISNSLGYIGGVYLRRVPYETCRFTGGGSLPQYCTLRYDESTATVRGTVREVRCNAGALDSVTVTLRELDRQPVAHRKIREFLTTRTGAFEISALEPGMRYAIRVRAKPQPDPFWGEIDLHTIHNDTLQFAPGEERQYDVNLERIIDC